VLDDAPLEVAGPGSLDGRVDQPLAAGHRVEEQLGRVDSCDAVDNGFN
jgi:hypothetical protein